MKNLYVFLNIKKCFFLIFLLVLNFEKSFSQETVIWNNTTANTVSINGVSSLTGVGVTVTASGVNGNYLFNPTNNTNFFHGTGSWASGVLSDGLTFAFSQPVIITKLTLSDINSSSNWNDSLNIINAGFVNSNPNNVFVNPNGVSIPDIYNGQTSAEFLCSNPLQNFGITFNLINGHSTAWLFYRIELIRIPQIDPICFNSLPPSFPVIGNGISGTWSPSVIDTSVSGDFVYTFTPNAGQAISCSVPFNVTILSENESNCCVNQISLTSPLDDVSNLTTPTTLIHRETSDWIIASNKIGIGDNVYQNGVVYHARNFVEFNPGFEALSGSQFSAYIQPCSGNYVYKNGSDNPKEKEVVLNENNTNDLIRNKISIYPNPTSGLLNLSLLNNKIKKVTLSSIEGKVYVFEQFDNSENVVLDLSNYTSGIYLINIETDQGEIINSKVIKN